MKKSIPLSKLIPPNRSPKQCRALLRRKGMKPKNGRWEFTPGKAPAVKELLASR